MPKPRRNPPGASHGSVDAGAQHRRLHQVPRGDAVHGSETSGTVERELSQHGDEGLRNRQSAKNEPKPFEGFDRQRETLGIDMVHGQRQSLVLRCIQMVQGRPRSPALSRKGPEAGGDSVASWPQAETLPDRVSMAANA